MKRGMVAVCAVVAVVASMGVNGFSTASVAVSPRQHLPLLLMSKHDSEERQPFVSKKAVHHASMAAAVLLSTMAFLEPSWAVDDVVLTDSSSLLLSARMGGRAGGRVSRGGFRAAPTRNIYRSSTTIIRPPSVIVAPPIGISPFGYGYGNPLGGFGLGYGLGAMTNSVGDSVRDYRQDTEISRDRAELELAKQRQAELEARINALESSSSAPTAASPAAPAASQ
jgi:hypothetical protein